MSGKRLKSKTKSKPAKAPRPIVIVGAGNMGAAFARGLYAQGLGAQVALVDPGISAAEQRRAKAEGARVAKSVAALGDIDPVAIVLAVKPQMMGSLLPAYSDLSKRALVVSIAAGTTIAKIDDWLGGERAIVRAMPNTPGAIGKGISAAFANGRVSKAQRAFADRLLRAIGDVVWIDNEDLIDPVTAVSGSGPAYVFLLVEALAKAGVDAGLPVDIAGQLARKTVEGAGALLAARPDQPQVLRQAVTSPGGTTEAALRVLMADKGIEFLLREAVAVGTARARELGK